MTYDFTGVSDILVLLFSYMGNTFNLLAHCFIFSMVSILQFIVVLFIINILVDNFYFSSRGRSPAQMKVNNGRWSKDE